MDPKLERVLHGESVSADRMYAEIEVGLPKLLHGVYLHDIQYGFDWLKLSIAAETDACFSPQKGIKQSKDRITVVLCTNATRTHKFKMIIGNAAKFQRYPPCPYPPHGQ